MLPLWPAAARRPDVAAATPDTHAALLLCAPAACTARPSSRSRPAARETAPRRRPPHRRRTVARQPAWAPGSAAEPVEAAAPVLGAAPVVATVVAAGAEPEVVAVPAARPRCPPA